MAKKGKGRAAKGAKRGLLGLPLQKRQKSKKFRGVNAQREEKALQRRDAAALRAQLTNAAEVKAEKVPHSMVVHTGKIGLEMRKLERDIRKVMAPNTAKDLQVKKHNNFKDFVVNACPLGVSHLLCFTRSELSTNLRIMRLPQGPTVHFKIESHVLARGVLSKAKRPVHFQALFNNSPMLIFNGFQNPERKHLLLVQTVIQNMFPTINVDTVNLKNIRRTILFNYNEETDTIDFRHYSIKATPSDVSKSTKKLIQSKIPDLSKYKDISDFLMNPGFLSESEYEVEESEVKLSQNLKSRGCCKGSTTKLRLSEIGPRMTLKVTKVEEGVDEGEIFYHAYHHKNPEEVAKLRKELPKIKKHQARVEKNIQHAVVRKMMARAKREQEVEERFNETKERLIRKQRQVTGDYSSEDDKQTVTQTKFKPKKLKLEKKRESKPRSE